MASRTMNIGELALKVKSADLAAQVVDTAIASDFEVEVEFDYTPGHPGNLTGRWEDAEEPIDPALEITAIRACSNVHFSGDYSDVLIRRDVDMMALFSGAQVTALEDELYKAIEKGNDE